MEQVRHVSTEKQAWPPLPLQVKCDERDWRLRGSREGTADFDEEENYRFDLKSEIEYYTILVNEGGRPSHPVSLGRDVLNHPEYHDILSYWNNFHENEWTVFEMQKGTWRGFRGYQQRNRKGDKFPNYAEIVKRSLARHGFSRPFELDKNLDAQDKLTT